MDNIINNVAGMLGMSGGELLIWIGIGIALVIAWVIVRSVLKLIFRVFATGCAIILGVMLGLYVLFNVIK
jgi:hypothetical protein